MPSGVSDQDRSWSSAGLARGEAIGRWREWASQTLAPIDVRVPNAGAFRAHWTSRDIGDLRFVQMGATAQRVAHPEDLDGPTQHNPTFQLVYSRHGQVRTRVGGRAFMVRPGEFVLLDNTRFYQMEMDAYHEALDLVMPQDWLAEWIPDPEPYLGRPFSARTGWGAPLGVLLDTMAEELGDSLMPRALLAEQVGSLLSLASGFHVPFTDERRDGLAGRVLDLIAARLDDPQLSLDIVARELGASKRTIHAALAGADSSFVQALNAARLDKAARLLAEPRLASLPVGEIGARCGYLDPGYFARLFRRRFGASPRAWRIRRLGA